MEIVQRLTEYSETETEVCTKTDLTDLVCLTSSDSHQIILCVLYALHKLQIRHLWYPSNGEKNINAASKKN